MSEFKCACSHCTKPVVATDTMVILPNNQMVHLPCLIEMFIVYQEMVHHPDEIAEICSDHKE